jgi:AcrR family transcriptional regulator
LCKIIRDAIIGAVPKVVDSDERRARLIAATSEAIARDGLANITLRSIARSAGWTTGIVTHYFADKRALLIATFLARADRARRQIDEAVAAGSSPLDALLATLPLDDERVLDWRVTIAFIGASIGDEEMGRLHRVRVDRFTRTVHEAIVCEQAAGTVAAHLDPALEADRLVVLINGIAVQVVIGVERYTPEYQRALVDAHLATLRPAATTTRKRRA